MVKTGTGSSVHLPGPLDVQRGRNRMASHETTMSETSVGQPSSNTLGEQYDPILLAFP